MVNVVCCLFVLENVVNSDKKKNDEKKLKILVNNNCELISNKFDFTIDIKKCAKDIINSAITVDKVNIEQVYTLGDIKLFNKKEIDVIYLALTNIENIKNINDGFELIDFDIIDDQRIVFNDNVYKYKTVKNENAEGSIYTHKINVDNINIEKNLVEVLTAYKYLRSKIDNTNIIFKLLPKYFTLEDVRLLYEKIKNVNVDKSNFRKKVQRYLIKCDKYIESKGYRPAITYMFDESKEEVWL